ncbi:MAG: hypothetical protein KA035_00635 [Candidatus Levybacteria bacterium]|nr:hypothetical protein [Candidatus Levybacteria bacterium]
MSRKECAGQFDPCLAQIRKPIQPQAEIPAKDQTKIVERKSVPQGHVRMDAGIQFVVNPQMPLPEGFKFGPVFI